MSFFPTEASDEHSSGKRLTRASAVLLFLFFAVWCISFFTNYTYTYAFIIICALFLLAIGFTSTDLFLALLVVGIYFQDSPIEIISSSVPALSALMVVVFCIIWGLKRSRDPIVRLRLKYFGFPGRFLFLFVLLYVLSSLAAENIQKTFIQGLPIVLIALFLMTLNDYFRTRRRMAVFIRNFCLIGGGLALYGILQYIVVRKQIFLFLQNYIVPLNWHDIGVKIGWKTSDLAQFKCSAFFHHQNVFGAVLASIAPLSLVMFFFHKEKKKKIFYLSLFFFMFVAEVLASSRGGLINMMVSTGIILLYVRPKHLWKMVFAGVAGVTAFILVYLDKILFYLRLSTGLSGRGQIWSYSMLMIEKSPWLGVGFLNMGEEFYTRFGPAYITDMILFFDKIKYTPVTDEIRFYNFHAHNLFINLAVEMGVFAAVGAFVFYFFILYRLWVFIHREKLKKWEKLMSVGLMGLLSGSFVHSFFDTNTLHYIFIHVVVLMGVERFYIIRLIDRDYKKSIMP